MKDLLKRALRIMVGIVLILLGIVGLFFPIMPGWILIIFGIMLLGPKTRLARWLTGKLHGLRDKYRQWRGGKSGGIEC